VTVWIYINTAREVGDVDHLKVFATADAADAWFAEHDPRALVLLSIGQMPEALIIPSIMLRRGQNGMNAMSPSYDWMRQRRKRRAACRSSLQPAYLGRKSIAAQTSPCLAIDFVVIGRHSKLRRDRYER
jgi:hypothetical protein